MIKCLLCKSNMKSKYLSTDQIKILYCPECGFERVETFPDESQLCRLYDNSYFKSYGDDINAQHQKQLYFKQILKTIHLKKCRKIFEVGCGKGMFLKICNQMGYEPFGLDISATAIEECKKYIDEDHLTYGSFENYTAKDPFDVVFMFDYIEHVTNPLKSIILANTILKTGGLLVITTPSPSSYLNFILRKKWPHYIPEHLCFFTKKAIELALGISNFKTVFIKYFPKIMSKSVSGRVASNSMVPLPISSGEKTFQVIM